MHWDGMTCLDDAIKLPDITNYIYHNANIQSEPLHHKCAQDRAFHIGRIIYFIKNPEKIDPIELDLDRKTGIIFVADGRHRIMACRYLKRKTINAWCPGPEVEYNYVCGRTNSYNA